MKQSRRKELRTNELQLWLQQTYQAIERNSTYILAGVLAVVAILVIGLLIQQRRHNRQQAAWSLYYELRGKDVTAEPDAMDQVRQLAEGWGDDAQLGPRVLQLRATMANELAMSLSRPDQRDRKIELLKEAAAAQQSLLERFGSSAVIAAEARMSLAGIEESLAVLGVGSIDKVRSYYQQLIETRPNPYADMAAVRLAQLEERLRPLEVVATRPAATAPAAQTAPAAPEPASPATATVSPDTQPATGPAAATAPAG